MIEAEPYRLGTLRVSPSRVRYSEYMVYVPSTRLVPRLMEAGTLSYHSLHTAYVPLTVLEKQYSTWQFPPQVVGL
jgi:hypothetical protein